MDYSRCTIEEKIMLLAKSHQFSYTTELYSQVMDEIKTMKNKIDSIEFNDSNILEYIHSDFKKKILNSTPNTKWDFVIMKESHYNKICKEKEYVFKKNMTLLESGLDTILGTTLKIIINNNYAKPVIFCSDELNKKID